MLAGATKAFSKPQLWVVCATTLFILASLWVLSTTNRGCNCPDPTTTPNDDEDDEDDDGFVTYPTSWPLPGKERANSSHFWSFKEGVCWDMLDDKWIMFIGDSVFRNTLAAMRVNAIHHGFSVPVWYAPASQRLKRSNDWTAMFQDKASGKQFYMTFRFIKHEAHAQIPKYFANFHEEQVRYLLSNGSTTELNHVFNKKVSEEILKWRKRPDVIFGNMGMHYIGNLEGFKEAVSLLFQLASSYGGKFIWKTVQGLGITEDTTEKMYRNSEVVEQNRFALELNKKTYKFDVFDGALVSFVSALSPEPVNDRHPDSFTINEYGECVMDILCGRTRITVPWAAGTSELINAKTS